MHDIVAPPRLWPDPIDPKRPGVLTREELDACKRILTLLASRSLQSLETVEWPYVDQRMLIALQLAEYIAIKETARRRAFQWLQLEITERGRLYMQQLCQERK